MKLKSILLLFLIVLLAFFIRMFKLGEIPSGFHNDETLSGYEAYSILKTGKDQYGTPFPISFKAFGDFRPGLFIYSIVPSIAIFGLNEFAIRLPSALYSTTLVVVVYFLALELLKSKRIALLSSFWLAIVPFSIQFGKMSHDTNLATLLMSLGILFYLLSRKKIYFLPISAIIFSLSMYVYYTTRVIVPLFLLYFLITDFKWLLRNIKVTVISGVLAIIMVLPIILSLVKSPDTFFSRANQVSIWGDKGLVANVIQGTTEDSYDYLTSISRFYHNKIVEAPVFVIKSFLNHFNIDYLVFNGDPDQLYKVPSFGILYLFDLILLIIGLTFLFRNKKEWGIIIFWLIVALIPDTLTRLSPTSSRIHFILPALSIIIALGINYIFTRKMAIAAFLFGILYLFNFSFFLHQYFDHLSTRYAKEWHYGLKEVVSEVSKREHCYDKIWVSKTLWGWINFVYYLQYPPEKLQKEIELKDINQYGIGWVYDFDKYHFDYFYGDLKSEEKILYVGEHGDFANEYQPIPEKIVYYPDKTEAYYLVSSNKQETDKCNPL